MIHKDALPRIPYTLRTKELIFTFRNYVRNCNTYLLLERKSHRWQKGRILRRSIPHCYNHKIPSHIDEFMDKLFRVTGYVVTCRYLVANEYITLSITDQETLEITFAVVTPPGNSLALYIESTVENPLILVYDHHVGGTSYLGEDIGEASLDDSISNNSCAEGGEMDVSKMTHAILI